MSPNNKFSMCETSPSIVDRNDLILVTGAGGFIGSRVVSLLLDRGFTRIRCLTRPSSRGSKALLELSEHANSRLELFRGNLLSPQDCDSAMEGVSLVYHLAASRGEKSFADAFLNSAVTSRNLLDAVAKRKGVKRFVGVSSFAVYSNRDKETAILDENAPLEATPHLRGEAYCFAKTKQDEIIRSYGLLRNVPWVILRPGFVYGPGNEGISSRIGIGTFGIFLHLGGGRKVPLSYVDNCAEAIVLAGLKPGVNNEVFNVVDDDIISSRAFLRLYKRNVRSFTSVPIPRILSYLLCWLWESYSTWSRGQLPPAYNRFMWHAYWKGSAYSNNKLKQRLGWTQKVSTTEGLRRYFNSCKTKYNRA